MKEIIQRSLECFPWDEKSKTKTKTKTKPKDVKKEPVKPK